MPQETFPLLCRGGNSLRFHSHQGDTQGTFNILGLFFKKGTRPISQGLASGECCWFDRAMSDNEPDILQQDVPANITSAPWFIDLKSPEKYWTFHVFNTNQGVFKIISADPLEIPPGAIPD
ncbi:hypothetical protein CN498_23390 [Bacillus thuringiensis]|uniref:hypothetical protein n=1 Tax=Bacillus thuringiensis TaxID=1428 RepID=UPI000BF40D13|nr:hypothetical protein [Bacillus thuringiensis]PER84888.1 hypothetical protein CN498_23390 [Bacillus thuringiensis]